MAKKTKTKKVPKGYHRMPNGKLMKDSAMNKKKKKILMAKQNALQKIESHEKLCRIMQKLTHDKINIIEDRVKRLEKILLICTGSLISAMGYVIITMLGL